MAEKLIYVSSSSSRFGFELLVLAVRDMLAGCFFVEVASTVWAIHHIVAHVILNLHHFLLLAGRLVVCILSHLYPGSEGYRLCLPLGYIFILLLLFDFTFNSLSLFHQSDLVFSHQSVFLCIELFPLFLVDFFAYFLMFGDPVSLKLPATSCAAHDQPAGIPIFAYIKFLINI